MDAQSILYLLRDTRGGESALKRENKRLKRNSGENKGEGLELEERKVGGVVGKVMSENVGEEAREDENGNNNIENSVSERQTHSFSTPVKNSSLFTTSSSLFSPPSIPLATDSPLLKMKKEGEGGRERGEKKKEKEEEKKKSVVRKLFLRFPEYRASRIFFSEIAENISVVIIGNNNQHDKEEELFKMVENYLYHKINRAYSLQFFKTRLSHLSSYMLQYLHQFPGLVHFILIERNKNVLYSPIPTSLAGRNFNNKVDNQEEVIRNKIWEMYSKTQLYLQKGYSSVLVKKHDFQFTYKLWVVCDDEEIVPDLSKSGNKLTLSPLHFKKLTDYYASLRGNKVSKLKCFEFYALYVGFLSTDEVQRQNKLLLETLKNDHPHWFS